MKIAVQKNHLVGQILYGSLDPKNGVNGQTAKKYNQKNTKFKTLKNLLKKRLKMLN